MKRKFAVLTAAIVGLSITAVTSVSSRKFYTFPPNGASAFSIIAIIKEVSFGFFALSIIAYINEVSKENDSI